MYLHDVRTLSPLLTICLFLKSLCVLNIIRTFKDLLKCLNCANIHDHCRYIKRNLGTWSNFVFKLKCFYVCVLSHFQFCKFEWKGINYVELKDCQSNIKKRRRCHNMCDYPLKTLFVNIFKVTFT